MGELFVAISAFLLEVFVGFLKISVLPFGFFLSNKYRAKKVEEWNKSTWIKYKDLGLVALWLCCIIAIASFWVLFFSSDNQGELIPKEGIKVSIKDKEDKEILKIKIDRNEIKELINTENMEALTDKLKEKIEKGQKEEVP